jgi:hypothetical protein
MSGSNEDYPSVYFEVPMKKLCLIVLLMFGAVPLCAQISAVREHTAQSDSKLSGNLRIDLFDLTCISVDSMQHVLLKDLPGYKSPINAALFSAVIPGAGQTYTERYWQGLAFFGAEVGLWVVYATYQSRGDRQTTDFQNFADAHYSVVRYADWITQYASTLAPNVNINTSGMVPNRNTSLPPWQQVDWNRINAVENQIMQSTDNAFTHNLPLRPGQQYYELIGKYPQFAPGWDSEINITPADLVANNVSSQFLNYRNMRGNANSLYAVASTATYVLVANHVFSALEAAWGAAVNNSNLKMGATLEPVRHSDGLVEFVPTARLQYTF